jgi:hypothetical protein
MKRKYINEDPQTYDFKIILSINLTSPAQTAVHATAELVFPKSSINCNVIPSTIEKYSGLNFEIFNYFIANNSISFGVFLSIRFFAADNV